MRFLMEVRSAGSREVQPTPASSPKTTLNAGEFMLGHHGGTSRTEPACKKSIALPDPNKVL
jgi:hypothetical protein